MKILVTGAAGFVGKNLCAELSNIRDGKRADGELSALELYKYDIDTPEHLLDEYTKDCDFVFHLAGVNRPEKEEDFLAGNYGFTSRLLESLEKNGNLSPVLITSSIQAALDNPYGRSKKAGEELIFSYGKNTGAPVYVYRLPGVFGKWCRPNYNSVVATFCHNIARGLDIKVNDPDTQLSLVYIDDVVDEFISALKGRPNIKDGYGCIKTVHSVTLGRLASLLYSFKQSRSTLDVPLCGGFEKALYSTFLSYLPEDEFCYPLKMNCDERGSFTEILRTADRGQFSVNIIKPGITKGNHWHHTKNEKFVVVKGVGSVNFMKVGDPERKVISYPVSGDKIEVVDIPTGYTHNIKNTGSDDMVCFMWCNECFDKDKPDTYFLEVPDEQS